MASLEDIQGALKMYGPLTVSEIVAKLLMRNIHVNDVQVLDGLNVLINRQTVRNSDVKGYYVTRV